MSDHLPRLTGIDLRVIQREVRFVFLSIAALAVAAEAQTVHGRVVHALTGTPLADISAVLLDNDRQVVRGTLTERDGSFNLTAPRSGKYRLRVGAQGFHTWDSQTLDLGEDDMVQQRVALMPEGQGRGLGDFERRRANEEGMFLTGPDLESRASNNFYDAFRGIPGVVWTSRGMSLVTGHAGAENIGARQQMEPSAACPPVLYVDGVWWGKLNQVNTVQLPSNELAAIEIYQRSEIPDEFRVNRDALCGVIVVWRKRR